MAIPLIAAPQFGDHDGRLARRVPMVGQVRAASSGVTVSCVYEPGEPQRSVVLPRHS